MCYGRIKINDCCLPVADCNYSLILLSVIIKSFHFVNLTIVCHRVCQLPLTITHTYWHTRLSTFTIGFSGLTAFLVSVCTQIGLPTVQCTLCAIHMLCTWMHVCQHEYTRHSVHNCMCKDPFIKWLINVNLYMQETLYKSCSCSWIPVMTLLAAIVTSKGISC